MTTPPPATAEGLQTEAAELQADIKETKIEADVARVAGDDARADKLEAGIAKTQKDLDEIKATLKQLTERPFHPAPGDGEPAAPPAGETPPAGESTTQDKPKGRPNRWFGQRWNEGD